MMNLLDNTPNQPTKFMTKSKNFNVKIKFA